MSEADALARLYLFGGVAKQDLAAFEQMLPMERIEPGQVLFVQGQPADKAYLVVDGRLVASVSKDGVEQLVGDIRPGEVVGESALYLDDAARSATVKASAPTLCLALDASMLREAYDNSAVVALEKHLLGTLSRRIRNTNLNIQRAWKEEASPPRPVAEASPKTLGERLRSLFGGVL